MYHCWCLYFDVSVFLFFFFKQKTAYEMRISDWSSDVCSSDLPAKASRATTVAAVLMIAFMLHSPLVTGNAVTMVPPRIWGSQPMPMTSEIGRASCRERVCQYV